jgi:hypothetical protein
MVILLLASDVSGNLSLEGGAGGSFEKSPSKQTEKHTEYQIEI